jgi:hypothetical protein
MVVTQHRARMFIICNECTVPSKRRLSKLDSPQKQCHRSYAAGRI